MSKRMLLCSIAAVAGFSAVAFAQEMVPNWPAPELWSHPVRVMASEKQSGVGIEAVEGVEAVPTSPLHFVGITPCRLADTRGNGFTGQYGTPALTPAGRNMVITGQCGIPGDAQAVSFNFSAVNVAAAGFLVAYPAGGAFPPVATMVYNQNTPNLSNAAIVPLGTAGAITVVAAVTTIDLVVDVNGYYRPGVVTSVTAGTGLSGGGTGAVTVGIANGGVGTTQLSDTSVTSAKIGANAVTAGAIATGQVVKSLNGLHDAVTLTGSGGTTVTPGVGTITINSSGGAAPAGSFALGVPGDTTLIGAGYTELGASNVDVWTATTTAGAPSARDSHTVVWTGTKMIVWGGTPDNLVFLNTGGQYDPVTDSWSSTTTTNAPSGRYRHTAVWTGTKMIVWGGKGLGGAFNTGGQYDPVGDSWLVGGTTTTNAPTAREGPKAVWTGTKMIVWGGQDGLAPYPTAGGQYDPVGNSWMVGGTSTTNAPTGREQHTAVWTGSVMVVFGGYDGMNYLDTGGRYDPVMNSWTATMPLGLSHARTQHTAVWTGSRMIVWGGEQGVPPYLNTGLEFDAAGDFLALIPTVGAPLGRFSHTAVWTGTRMIVWGGIVSTPPPGSASLGPHNSGGTYDPVNRSWANGGTGTTGAPTSRYKHTAVWAGNRMVVWGGDFADRTNTGSRYAILSLYVKN